MKQAERDLIFEKDMAKMVMDRCFTYAGGRALSHYLVISNLMLVTVLSQLPPDKREEMLAEIMPHIKDVLALNLKSRELGEA